MSNKEDMPEGYGYPQRVDGWLDSQGRVYRDFNEAKAAQRYIDLLGLLDAGQVDDYVFGRNTDTSEVARWMQDNAPALIRLLQVSEL